METSELTSLSQLACTDNDLDSSPPQAAAAVKAADKTVTGLSLIDELLNDDDEEEDNINLAKAEKPLPHSDSGFLDRVSINDLLHDFDASSSSPLRVAPAIKAVRSPSPIRQRVTSNNSEKTTTSALADTSLTKLSSDVLAGDKAVRSSSPPTSTGIEEASDVDNDDESRKIAPSAPSRHTSIYTRKKHIKAILDSDDESEARRPAAASDTDEDALPDIVPTRRPPVSSQTSTSDGDGGLANQSEEIEQFDDDDSPAVSRGEEKKSYNRKAENGVNMLEFEDVLELEKKKKGTSMKESKKDKVKVRRCTPLANLTVAELTSAETIKEGTRRDA